jgi:hypothetical protein
VGVVDARMNLGGHGVGSGGGRHQRIDGLRLAISRCLLAGQL